MDYLPDHETLSLWLVQYGSITLFVLLTIGIVALPVPEETLMVLAGTAMSKGYLNIPATVIAAYAGSLCGISISYLLGRTLGHYLIQRYGNFFGLTELHLQKAERWFERFGKWTLFIGYFIPGVRHFTGFSAGMAELSFKHFALYAYTGAIFWASTFLSIGYFLGPTWISLLFEHIEIDMDEAFIGLVVIVVCYLGIRLILKKMRSQ
ncbi:DedA family protein [Candidatus Protochlamydia phocaeensis]|uniref:DedA family protein n=1 Tax=Candidatus Protochlamydia phocaeensis TaxID=1414722 RepID=UPI0008397E97|nr:DedA family protein [Candidatus Protochlamydia phocaeensis]